MKITSEMAHALTLKYDRENRMMMMNTEQLNLKYPLPDGFIWIAQQQNQLIGIVNLSPTMGAGKFQIWLHMELGTPAHLAKWVVRSYDRKRELTIVKTRDEALDLTYARFLLGEY